MSNNKSIKIILVLIIIILLLVGYIVVDKFVLVENRAAKKVVETKVEKKAPAKKSK